MEVEFLAIQRIAPLQIDSCAWQGVREIAEVQNAFLHLKLSLKLRDDVFRPGFGFLGLQALLAQAASAADDPLAPKAPMFAP